MTDDSTRAHATFTLERTFATSPQRVFAAWSAPESKAQWFAAPDSAHSLDFRVGGSEVARGSTHDGHRLAFETTYAEIEQDARIVYTSRLLSDDVVATVSMTTVEFFDAAGGTRLVLTETGSFLDGKEQPEWREQGTNDQLDALGKLLEHA